MKCIYFSLTLLASILLYACDDCSDYACTTPPNEFAFEIIGSEISDSATVSIQNTHTNTTLEIEKQDSIYICSTIGWEIGENNKNYALHIDTLSFPFIYHTESKSIDCCALLGDLIEFSSKRFDISQDSFHYILTIGE